MLLCIAGVFSTVAFGAAPSRAMQSDVAEREATVVLTSANVTVDADDTGRERVTARYRFQVDTDGAAGGSIKYINGTLFSFPDAHVSDITVTVNGHSVEAVGTRSGRILRYTVPVPKEYQEKTVMVTLSYRVSGPRDQFRAPIWVPEFGPAGTDRVVGMRVSIPADSGQLESTFPTVRERTNDGRVLRFRLTHVPAFVSVQYDSTSGPLTTSTLSAVAAIGLITTILVAGWLSGRKRVSREGF